MTINNGIVDFEQATYLPSNITINSPGHLWFNGVLQGAAMAMAEAAATDKDIARPATSIANNGDFGVSGNLKLGTVSGSGELAVTGSGHLTASSIVQHRLVIGGASTMVASVPEPGTLVLLALAGLALAGAYVRRK